VSPGPVISGPNKTGCEYRASLHQTSAIVKRGICLKLSEGIVKSIELIGKESVMIEMER
jgi:hypothetical protein